jgi:hypothetical protein
MSKFLTLAIAAGARVLTQSSMRAAQFSSFSTHKCKKLSVQLVVGSLEIA